MKDPQSPKDVFNERRLDIRARQLINPDMPKVLQIERDSFAKGWGDVEFLDRLRQRYNQAIVATTGDKVAGFMVYELARGQYNILKMAVAPAFRRQHAGQELIADLFKRLNPRRRSKVQISIPESGQDTQSFLRKQGFKAAGVIRNHCDTGEDAYIMQFRLNAPKPEFLPKAISAKEAFHKAPLDVITRWMIRYDMPNILQIENDNFLSPWQDDDFLCCTRERNVMGMVADYNQKALGYMLYHVQKSHIEIIRLAVAPEFQHQNVGHALIQRLIDKPPNNLHRKIIMNVQESNLGAQLFFRSQGFKAASTIQDHLFDDVCENAYVMNLD